jgi:hypothetical protein
MVSVNFGQRQGAAPAGGSMMPARPSSGLLHDPLQDPLENDDPFAVQGLRHRAPHTPDGSPDKPEDPSPPPLAPSPGCGAAAPAGDPQRERSATPAAPKADTPEASQPKPDAAAPKAGGAARRKPAGPPPPRAPGAKPTPSRAPAAGGQAGGAPAVALPTVPIKAERVLPAGPEAAATPTFTKAELPPLPTSAPVPRTPLAPRIDALQAAPTDLFRRGLVSAAEKLPASDGVTPFVPRDPAQLAADRERALGFLNPVPPAQLATARAGASRATRKPLAAFNAQIAAQRAALVKRRAERMFDSSGLLATILADAKATRLSVAASGKAALARSAAATNTATKAIQGAYAQTAAGLKSRHQVASKHVDVLYAKEANKHHGAVDVSGGHAMVTQVLNTAAQRARDASGIAASHAAAYTAGNRAPDQSEIPGFDFAGNGWNFVKMGMASFWTPPADAGQIRLGGTGGFGVVFNNYKSPVAGSSHSYPDLPMPRQYNGFGGRVSPAFTTPYGYTQNGAAPWENNGTPSKGSYEAYAADAASQAAAAVGAEVASEIMSSGYSLADEMRGLIASAEADMHWQIQARQESVDGARLQVQAGLAATLEQSLSNAAGIAAAQVAALQQSQANYELELTAQQQLSLDQADETKDVATAAIQHTADEGQRIWETQVDSLIEGLDARQHQAHFDIGALSEPDEASIEAYLASALTGATELVDEGEVALDKLRRGYRKHAATRCGELSATFTEQATSYADSLNKATDALVANIAGVAASPEIGDVLASFDAFCHRAGEDALAMVEKTLGPNPNEGLRDRLFSALNHQVSSFTSGVEGLITRMPRMIDNIAQKVVAEAVGSKGDFIGKLIGTGLVALGGAIAVVVVTIVTLGIGTAAVAIGFSQVMVVLVTSIVLAVVGALAAIVVKVLTDAINGKLTNPAPDLWIEYLIEFGTGFITGLFSGIAWGVGLATGALKAAIDAAKKIATVIKEVLKVVVDTFAGIVIDFVAMPFYWLVSEANNKAFTAESWEAYFTAPANLAGWLTPNLLGALAGALTINKSGEKWLKEHIDDAGDRFARSGSKKMTGHDYGTMKAFLKLKSESSWFESGQKIYKSLLASTEALEPKLSGIFIGKVGYAATYFGASAATKDYVGNVLDREGLTLEEFGKAYLHRPVGEKFQEDAPTIAQEVSDAVL